MFIITTECSRKVKDFFPKNQNLKTLSYYFKPM